MTRAFIVTLSVEESSPDSDAGLAEQIQEALIQDGLPVTQVNPWSTPSTGVQAPSISSLIQPETTSPTDITPSW